MTSGSTIRNTEGCHRLLCRAASRLPRSVHEGCGEEHLREDEENPCFTRPDGRGVGRASACREPIEHLTHPLIFLGKLHGMQVETTAKLLLVAKRLFEREAATVELHSLRGRKVGATQGTTELSCSSPSRRRRRHPFCSRAGLALRSAPLPAGDSASCTANAATIDLATARWDPACRIVDARAEALRQPPPNVRFAPRKPVLEVGLGRTFGVEIDATATSNEPARLVVRQHSAVCHFVLATEVSSGKTGVRPVPVGGIRQGAWRLDSSGSFSRAWSSFKPRPSG